MAPIPNMLDEDVFVNTNMLFDDWLYVHPLPNPPEDTDIFLVQLVESIHDGNPLIGFPL